MFSDGKTGDFFKHLIIAFFIFISSIIFVLLADFTYYFFLIIGVCFLYEMVVITLFLLEGNSRMENATLTIQKHIAGESNQKIKCNEEGCLPCLFQEINSLFAIMDSKIESEKELNFFLKDLIADISHQLKTPIATLVLYSDIIQEGDLSIDEIYNFVELSQTELDRMTQLTQNLLKMAKFEAKTIVLKQQLISIGDVFIELQQIFDPMSDAEEKSLQFLGNRELLISCDKEWLVEAISNVISNSFDHTTKGNYIKIEATPFSSLIQIKIEDNGEGIAPEDVPHIFKRFYRSKFSSKKSGAGLGLSLTKTIIEGHPGGRVEVKSTKNKGTKVTLIFLNMTKM